MRLFGHWHHTTRRLGRWRFVVHVVASTDFLVQVGRYHDSDGDLTYALGLGWVTINIYPLRPVPPLRALESLGPVSELVGELVGDIDGRRVS